MQRLEITIHGRVQGVCFRYYTKDKAQKLGLKGYVRNANYDRVEIVAEGGESSIKQLLEFAKKGPPSAHVTECTVDYHKATGEFDNFSIRY